MECRLEFSQAVLGGYCLYYFSSPETNHGKVWEGYLQLGKKVNHYYC